MFQDVCDDCRKLVFGEHLAVIQINGKDLCESCIRRRVDYTTTILPIGAMCIQCEGDGEIEGDECFGCGGSGQAQFRR